ncbi:MAG: phage terminase large subunit [Hyphomonadaceae bacterium]|nr:phage terminase large subunit [Hyphomonadaceae bacterium]
MNDLRIFQALLRNELRVFVRKVFNTLHPGTLYLDNWHVEAMCYALEQAILGNDSNRLLITVPPRHLKSICASVALSAWIMGRDPSHEILVASYGADLAVKHARDFRTVVEAGWYKGIFPWANLPPKKNTETEYVNAHGGHRKAVSLGGSVTGFGAGTIIIDDMMKAQDAHSQTERERVKNYYDETLYSRLNSKTNGKIIAIQQRIHEDDLPGYLLEKDGYNHLNLPSIADEVTDIQLYNGVVHRREIGDILFEASEPKDALDKMRLEIGAYAFSAQYLQNPTPLDGARIRWEEVATYSHEPKLFNYQMVVQSWDTAMTSEQTSDYSVCATWGFREGFWDLIDIYRHRLDFGPLKQKVVSLGKKYRADKIIIERAGTGFPLIQELNADGYTNVRAITPKQDKVVRFEAQAAKLMSGKYRIPQEAAFLTEFKRELSAFPSSKYDDQVDAISQFLYWSGLARNRDPNSVDQKTGRRLKIKRRSIPRRKDQRVKKRR